MKILVTGAAGFIGSHTCKALLKKDYQVIGLDNFNDYYSPLIKENNLKELILYKNFRMIKGDILNQELLTNLFKKEKFIKVCHLAARAGVRPSIADPYIYEEVNVRGTLNLLEQCKINQIKNFVFASSSSVYGESKKIPFKENQKLDQPISPYAATKKATENMAHVYSHLYGISCIGLRFFTVFGPAGRPDMSPFLFTQWINNNQAIKLFGDGSATRDFTYIDDIVDGVIKALDYQTHYEIFNLGRGKPITIKKFITIIENILHKKAIIHQEAKQQGDVSRTFADITKAKEILQYQPQISTEKGMEIFIAWYLKNYKQ